MMHHATIVIGDWLLEGPIWLIELLGIHVGGTLIRHVVWTRCRRLYLHRLLSLLAYSLIGATVISIIGLELVWLEGVLHLLLV